MTTAKSMIEEVCSVDGKRFRYTSLNDLADHFRNGESLRTLIPLLTHHDPEVASGGAWIASEVVDHSHGREIFDELSQLLIHPDPAVQYWAISSVAVLAMPHDCGALTQLVSMVADTNPGVRMQALRYVCILPDSTIRGLDGTAVWPQACLLMCGAEKMHCINAIISPVDLTRRLGIAGILRNFGDDPAIVEELVGSLSDIEASELEGLPKCRSSTL